MKITRTPLDLVSSDYSREWDVDRGTGIHLMEIVEYIGKTSGIEKPHRGTKQPLDNFATPGFLWEHVMSRTERLEHALSIEAIRMDMVHNPDLLFPGEMFWCRQCDEHITGGKYAQAHANKHGHRGIYYTPDAFDFVDQSYVEWKFTWKSSKRSDPSRLDTADGIWRWPVQCMWNAMGLGVNKAKLIALHCCGDYGPGLNEPEPYEITMEFTDKELRNNKRMIVSNAISKGWI